MSFNSKSISGNEVSGDYAPDLLSEKKSDDDAKKLLKLSQCLMNISLRALGRRRLTEHQLREMMMKKISRYVKRGEDETFDQEKISDETEKIIVRMRELGYVNDADYAEIFIRDTMQYRPHGSLWITMQLSRKGIDRDVVTGALARVGAETGMGTADAGVSALDYETALLAAEKKWRVLSAKSSNIKFDSNSDIANSINEKIFYKKSSEKLFRFLCGRGFSASIAMRVMREVTNG